MTDRYPKLADCAAFVDSHGDETWFLAPILEESDCRHGHDTMVPYGEGMVSLRDAEVCDSCIRAAAIDRVWHLYEEGVLSWDPTETYLEVTS